MRPPDDTAGPTLRRLAQSGGCYTEVGQSKSTKHFAMLDDALGRAWMRQKILAEEYSALRRYALHWLAGGLSGHLGSVDLNRLHAHDAFAMTGLAKTERQVDHRKAYYAARSGIGIKPAFVADHVACFDVPLVAVGIMMGYRSRPHARIEAGKVLSDAGYRLGQFWKDRDR